MKNLRYILEVARRELHHWRSHPVSWLGALVTMGFGTVFFVTMFSCKLPSDLPVGVVDNDRSYISRMFVSQLNTTPLGEVKQYETFTDARRAMQRGDLTAICVIPERFQADIEAFRQPTFTFYVNSLYFVGGSLSYKNILTMVNLTAGAVQKEVLQMKGFTENAIMGRIKPIAIDTHQIGNPETDYGVYLNAGLLPGFLQMTVILTLIYAFGSELKDGTASQVLERAGQKMSNVIMGKLLVYIPYFLLLGYALILLLFWGLGYPLKGSLWYMILDVTLLVLASASVSLFILECLPICRFASSVGAVYSVLGFSLAGFTLPVEAMLPGIRGLAAIFPLRHYFGMYVQTALFGSGFAGCWLYIVYLLLFLLLPWTGYRRLRSAYHLQNFPRN